MSELGSGIGSAVGMVGGPIGSLIGGALGGLLGGTDHSAEDRMKAIQDLYSRIQTPGFDYSSLTPQEKAVVGQMTPEAMQALEMAPAQQVQDGGQGRDAQLQALKQLQGMGNGGLNLQDKADLQSIQNQQAATNRGQQDAITANAHARGVGGGGSELAAKMMAQQGAADSAASQGTQILANDKSRALQALQAAGQAGSNLRSQDVSTSSRNADIINQFNQNNFANKQGIANQNVANRNAAQGFNLSNAQNLSNSNVDTGNAFQQYNQQNQNNLKQQQFGNELAKVNGQAGAAQATAQYQNANAAGQQKQAQGIGSALGNLAGQGLQSMFGSTPSSGSSGSNVPTSEEYYKMMTGGK